LYQQRSLKRAQRIRLPSIRFSPLKSQIETSISSTYKGHQEVKALQQQLFRLFFIFVPY